MVGRWQVHRGQGDKQTIKIDKSLTVIFSNTGSAPLALFWKDPLEGAELDRGVIMPNADRPIDSFVGHHFVIRLSLPTAAGGRIVKEWIAAAERPGMQTVPLDSVANSSSAFYSSPDLPEAELEELIKRRKPCWLNLTRRNCDDPPTNTRDHRSTAVNQTNSIIPNK